jgi:hypothetical protein
MSKNNNINPHPMPTGAQLAANAARLRAGRAAPLPEPTRAAFVPPLPALPDRATAASMAQAEQEACRIYEAEAHALGYPPRRNN